MDRNYLRLRRAVRATSPQKLPHYEQVSEPLAANTRHISHLRTSCTQVIIFLQERDDKVF